MLQGFKDVLSPGSACLHLHSWLIAVRSQSNSTLSNFSSRIAEPFLSHSKLGVAPSVPVHLLLPLATCVAFSLSLSLILPLSLSLSLARSLSPRMVHVILSHLCRKRSTMKCMTSGVKRITNLRAMASCAAGSSARPEGCFGCTPNCEEGSRGKAKTKHP